MIHVSVASARLQAACGSSLSRSEGPSQDSVLESMVWSHCLLHNDTDGGSALTSQMTLCINASDQRSLQRFLFVFTS